MKQEKKKAERKSFSSKPQYSNIEKEKETYVVKEGEDYRNSCSKPNPSPLHFLDIPPSIPRCR